jgi:hypothetical protein
MRSPRSQLASVPTVQRFAVVGSAVLGVVGALVGLVLGLRAYPPTAWFAVIEVAVPAAVAGGLLGALVGLVAVVVRRRARR